ncbi:MAG: FtsX-like permease family protein [Desulfofustis sp.]|nr:FtsX-like permease family protein [Desulfofustis sp.]
MLVHFYNRQRNILDYGLGSLWRNRLKNGGVLLVFSFVIFMVASFSLVVGSLEQSAGRILESVPDITVQQLSGGRQTALRRDDVGAVADIFGISQVLPRVWGYYFDETNGANYTVIGDSRFGGEGELPGLAIISGDKTAVSPRGIPVVIGQGIKRNMKLGDRRNFSFFRPDLSLMSFQVIGEFPGNTALVTDDLIVMDLDAARNLFNMHDDEITDLLVSVANPEEIRTIALKISEKLHGSRVITREQIGKTYRVAFGWRSGFGLVCLFCSVAAFIILAWDKATGLSPDQRREVAILKALGWQTGDVMTLRFWESAAVSCSAFLLGYSLAWTHLLFFDGALFSPVLLGWSVLRPPLQLVPAFRAEDILIIFSLSVLPFLAATVIPAWRSAMARPDSVV